eukprot:scaffold60018_cov57-Phaeocystis_antarctica.AAC.1
MAAMFGHSALGGADHRTTPFGHRHRRVPRLAPHPGHRRPRVLLRLAPGNRPTREGSTTTTRRRACLGLFLAFLQKKDLLPQGERASDHR